MKKILGFLLLLLPVAAAAQTCTTATCTASSMSESAVLAALPSSGNTNSTVVVNLPTGTGSWTTHLVYTVPAAVTNLTIQGNTTVTCTGTHGTSSYACTATDHSIIEDNDTTNEHVFEITANGVSSLLRITGLTIEGGSSSTAKNDGILIVSGPSHNFRMDHVHINATTYSFTASFMTRFFGDLEGVVDHSICDLGSGTTNCFGASVNINDTIGQGDGNWAEASNWGSEEFIYFEDDVINGGMMTDCDTGGRFVVRYSSLLQGTTGSATIHNHGTKTPGGRIRSCRAYEAYHNYLIGPSGSSFAALGMAGGTALIWDNNLAGLYSRLGGFGASRNDGSETETNTPSGWGYCGTTLSGTGSNWDGNQNSSTGYPCLDGIGRGQDVQALNGSGSIATAKNSVTGTIAWPQNYLEPVYLWGNTATGVGSELSISDESTQQNRDVYIEQSGFNGTAGTGAGLLSARPATCTAGPNDSYTQSPTGSYGVGYWATDANSGKGELYVCTATDIWTGIYQPYTYPHPLIGGGLTSTSISLSASNLTPAAGANITLTARVTPSSGPTGTVTILDGGSPVGTCTLSAGSCTYNVTSITSGTHSYTAAYGGNSAYASSTSSAATVTVSSIFTIHYTTDGSTPTCSSSTYSSGFSVGTTTTVKAIACASGYNNSAVASAVYTFGGSGGLTATPTFSPAAGAYSATQYVFLSDTTSGAVIYYTTDGSTPTTASNVYSSPLAISATATIKAMAAAPGLTNSSVASATYTITSTLIAATPTFSPAPGIFTGTQTVTIADSSPSPTIYYTTDGSTPTVSSSVYSTPLTVTSTTTVKAIATASGYSTSLVGAATYTIGCGQTPFVTGNIDPTQIKGTSRQGAGPLVQMGAGSFTTGHAMVYDCNGDAVDAGSPPTVPNFVDGEAPSGTVNGSNVTFTLAHSPSPATSLKLYFNGLRERLTTDYTLSGATVTFTSAPDAGGLLADYRY